MTNEQRSEAARLLALSRQQRELTCPVDGVVFLARNRRAVYCSPRCLMRARRAKAKAAALTPDEKEEQP